MSFRHSEESNTFTPLTSAASILSFGHDLQLLDTRNWVLSRSGFAVTGVFEQSDFQDKLHTLHFDLLLFCHTLSPIECEAALATASALAPDVTRLVLRAEAVDRPSLITHLTAKYHPVELIRTVRSLIHPRYLPGTQEGVQDVTV